MKKKVFYGALALLAALAVYLYCAAAPYAKPPKPGARREHLTEQFLSSEVGPERVRLVESPAEGLPARMWLLAAAETSLDISYYAVHPGASTDTVLGGILAAADRGVQVRLLLDGMFGKLERACADALAGHPNIQLKYYNPVDLTKPQALNARLHDKYVLADGKYLLLGGTNLGDKYLVPEGYSGFVSQDREVLVYGDGEARADSVFTAVKDYLDTLWAGPWVREQPGDARRDGGAGETLRRAAQAYSQENEALLAAWDRKEALPAGRVRFLSGAVNPGPKAAELGALLAGLTLEAEHSVVMQSPYVILDEALDGFLTALGEKGVDAKILTNSVASSPNPTARAVYAGDRREIPRPGLTLYEYQGPGALHAKTYVLDERLVLLGSYNLDPRSANIDTELMLAIDSPALASAVGEAQARSFAQSLPVLPGGEYGEGSVEIRPVSAGKRLVTALLGPAARAFRYLV